MKEAEKVFTVVARDPANDDSAKTIEAVLNIYTAEHGMPELPIKDVEELRNLLLYGKGWSSCD